MEFRNLENNESKLYELDIHYAKFCAEYNVIGYPYCDRPSELMAELKLYYEDVGKYVYLIYQEAEAIGYFVLLQTDDKSCFLAGPVRYDCREDVDFYDSFFESLKTSARLESFRFYSICTINGNSELDVYLSKHSVLASRNLEMVFDLNALENSLMDEVNDDNILNFVNPSTDYNGLLKLFMSTHNISNEAKLMELLNDGYELYYIKEEGVLKSLIVFVGLENTNFGRIDYLSTDPLYPKQGYATWLVKYALREFGSRKLKKVYLSTDPTNTKAIALYQKLDFKITKINNVYRYEV